MEKPIYIQHKTMGRLRVATVKGDTMFKTIRHPSWEIRKPPGIGFDCDSLLHQAVDAGAKYIRIYCPYKPQGQQLHWAAIGIINIPVSRGHNQQVELAWPHWRKSKDEAKAYEMKRRCKMEETETDLKQTELL